ncbi:MAG TPA: hypothetical protein VFS43_15935 [Polyangiaceae bacterium]|nr:hypothetical protein [Polyangiaceae bacterium]
MGVAAHCLAAYRRGERTMFADVGAWLEAEHYANDRARFEAEVKASRRRKR